ncbi:DUF58 domain-containing protein [Niallia sp. 01092]|uniref:DUF58 domain-containing protein n=1 Tax=unclassified Niallia TaxID=2837522 RepID=UPI003FD3D8EF
MKVFFKKLIPVWKLILLFVLIGITFSYAMFQGGFVSWFLFYSFLPFAIYGLLLAIYSVKEWEVVRRIEKHEYNAKETLKVEIELNRKSYLPIFYLLVEDSLSQSLTEERTGKKLLLPAFKRQINYEYEIKELPRGEHIFYHTKVKIGDPLGLMEKEAAVPNVEKIIVYPTYEEMIYKPFENQFDQGMTASKERVQRDTTMAVGIREYQPGDRFSWINWKASAKRNSMMTKEFEQRQSHDIMVVMDCEENSRFEILVSFTATLIRAILKKGAQVGLLSFEEEKMTFPIRGGDSQQQLLFYHLAKATKGSKISLAQLIENETPTLQQNATLMLVTANLSKELVEKTSYLASKKFNIGVFLIKDIKESLTTSERNLRAALSSRGIRVIPVSNGRFQDAFSEVKTG